MSSARPPTKSKMEVNPHYSKTPCKQQDVPTYEDEYVETEFHYANAEELQRTTRPAAVSSCINPMLPSPRIRTPASPMASHFESSEPAKNTDNSRKQFNGIGYFLVLGVALLVCVSVVALVAVILYRPTAATLDTASIAELVKSETAKQFQGQVDAIRAANSTFSLDQLANTRLDSFQNTMLGFSALLSNLREDLDQLRSVDLYRGCTYESRECTLSTSSTTHWRNCLTSSITVNPQNQDSSDYVTNIWCDINGRSYMESTYIFRNGDSVQCQCHVTWPNAASNTHNSFSTYSATCTLRVTSCPRTVNLLL